MGDLLSKEMLFDLLLNIINIVVLFLVTKKLLYKPVMKILEQRRENLRLARQSAEDEGKKALEAKEKYETMVADAQNVCKSITDKALNEADEKGRAIIDEANAKAKEIISKSEAQAEIIRNTAISDSKKDISEAAVAIAGKILARECNDEDNKAIIDAYFRT